jgi:signal transduction histidine kinase
MNAGTVERCSPEQLRTLFLFEKLTDAQLDWLCQRGRVEAVPAGPVYAEGDPARSFYVLLEGGVVLSRRVGDDDIDVGVTSQPGVYAGAWRAYLGDQVPQVYDQSMRVTRPSRFFVLGADVFAQFMRDWFPLAVHLLDGGFLYRRNVQELTTQRERLLALGTLSAGLTHELNNPAAAAVLATASLRDRVSKMRRGLGAMAANAWDRTTLETLIRLQDEAAERVPKAPHLTFPAGIRVVKDYDRSLPAIPAYPAELNQAWTNLIDNAVSAMGDEGVLTVRTGRDRDHIVVDIRDTGPGVPPQIRERIFEPFFTTKPVGQGTGLGLDITRRIVVKKHHGDVTVESVPGDTRFRVRLPVAAAGTQRGTDTERGPQPGS